VLFVQGAGVPLQLAPAFQEQLLSVRQVAVVELLSQVAGVPVHLPMVSIQRQPLLDRQVSLVVLAAHSGVVREQDWGRKSQVQAGLEKQRLATSAVEQEMTSTHDGVAVQVHPGCAEQLFANIWCSQGEAAPVQPGAVSHLQPACDAQPAGKDGASQACGVPKQEAA
jgi:hypothetical protein